MNTLNGYTPDPAQVARLADRFREPRCTNPFVPAFGALEGSMRHLAQQHHTCEVPDCPTCRHLHMAASIIAALDTTTRTSANTEGDPA